MATWNADKPASANEILEDVADIEENFQELHDLLEDLLIGTLGTTDSGAFKFDLSAGCEDGSGNTVDVPTNGMANAKFMLGDSNSIAWMYLNSAPPGWKALATGADTVLAISGGAQAYNANGGTAGGTWTQPNHTHTAAAHTHSITAHQHAVPFVNYIGYLYHENACDFGNSGSYTLASITYKADRTSSALGETACALTSNSETATTASDGDDATGNGATANTWRPSASIGKLFQLDTA